MRDPEKIKIVVDPGHGGEATGAVGPTGLLEKGVNLKVAGYLEKFLKEEGFTVILTREGDYDVPLEERVRIAVENNADIFISIHHNASALLNRNINRTELYCPFEPYSPSFDLAYKLMKNFRKRFGLPVESPLPARYRVLKENVPVAVLTEASYITHPEEEEMLKSEERLILEAEIIFESILEFIEQGLVKIKNSKIGEDCVRIKYSEEINRDSVVVFLDGERFDLFEVNSKEIVITIPHSLRGGEHTLSVYGRCLRGNAIPPCSVKFKKKTVVESFSHVLKNFGIYNLLRVKFFDPYLNPVPPGIPFYFQTRDCTVRYSTSVTDEQGEVYLVLEMEKEHVEIEFELDRFDGVIHVDRYPARRRVVYGQVVDAVTGTPLEGVKIQGGDESTVSEKYGLFEIEEEKLIFSKTGYYVREEILPPGEFNTVKLEPLYNGTLHGKKIFIYPARGGKDKGEVTGKLPASLINLKIALLLERLLSFSGAEVMLSRYDDETTIDEVECVKRIEKYSPDIAVQIDTTELYPGAGYYLFYYYRDSESKIFAELVKKYTHPLGFIKPEILEYGSYFIIHPRAPRILVNPSIIMSLKDFDLEELIKVVAISIFGGILEFFEFKGFRLKKYTLDRKSRDIVITSEDLPVSISTGEEVYVPFARRGSKLILRKGNKEKRITLKEGSCILWQDGN